MNISNDIKIIYIIHVFLLLQFVYKLEFTLINLYMHNYYEFLVNSINKSCLSICKCIYIMSIVDIN